MSSARRFTMACGAIVFTTACASNAPPNTTATGPATSGATQTAHADASAPSRFGTVPLRLIHAADAGAGPAVELRPDGTIVAGTEVIARLVHEGTTLPNGAPLISVESDGAISIRGQRTALRMEANGDVNSTGGSTAGASFTIEPDGTPAEHHVDAGIERSWGRFESIPAGARPTAALIYLTVLAERPGALPGANTGGDASANSGAPQPPAAPSPAPAATEPTLALGEELRAEVRGLPAISPDNATVAVADVAHDGLRGAPNLTVRMFDARTGAARQAIPVLSVREGASDPQGPAAEALRRTATERLTRAQTAVRGFHPLTALTFGPAGDGTTPVEASAEGVRLTFTPSSRELLVRDLAGAQRHRQVLAPIRATGARRRPECVENPPIVREAWVDRSSTVLVFHLEYSGTDSCVSPEGSYRVVRLSNGAGPGPSGTSPNTTPASAGAGAAGSSAAGNAAGSSTARTASPTGPAAAAGGSGAARPTPRPAATPAAAPSHASSARDAGH